MAQKRTSKAADGSAFRSFLALLDLAGKRQRYLIGVCLLASVLSEAVGLAGLLPFIVILFGDSPHNGGGRTRQILDALHAFGIPLDLHIILGLFLVALVLKAVGSVLSARYVSGVVANNARILRAIVIKLIGTAKVSHFTEKSNARFTAAIGGDVNRASDAMQSGFQFCISAVLGAAYFIGSLAYSWKLALTAVAFSLLMISIFSGEMQKTRALGREQSRRTRGVVIGVHEILGNLKAFRAMSRMGILVDRCLAQSRVLYKLTIRQQTHRQRVRYLQEPFLGFGLCSGIILGVEFLHIPVTDVVVMMIFFGKVVDYAGKLQQQYQTLLATEGSWLTLKELISELEADQEVVHGGKAVAFHEGIEFRDVAFSHGARSVLSHASFRIPARGLTLIRGTSGAGKTTILDLCLGFNRPAVGQVLVDEVPLDDIDIEALRRQVGYVPQEVTLLNDTVRENVTLGDKTVEEEQVWHALAQAGVDTFIAALPDALETRVGERGARLSGGERQRLALARALAHKPRLVILDEATSAIDHETKQRICETVARLKEEIAIIAVSHGPEWDGHADRVILVEGGTARPAPSAIIGRDNREPRLA
jgi:ATP-binding cassette, subfamily C, bacterial